MPLSYRTIKARTNTRRLCAVAFLAFLSWQVGSHIFLDSHSHEELLSEITGVFLDDHHHEGDCEVFLDCYENNQPDQEVPNLQDEYTHHHVLGAASLFRFIRDSKSAERRTFARVLGDLRTLQPPYLPPKRS